MRREGRHPQRIRALTQRWRSNRTTGRLTVNTRGAQRKKEASGQPRERVVRSQAGRGEKRAGGDGAGGTQVPGGQETACPSAVKVRIPGEGTWHLFGSLFSPSGPRFLFPGQCRQVLTVTLRDFFPPAVLVLAQSRQCVKAETPGNHGIGF